MPRLTHAGVGRREVARVSLAERESPKRRTALGGWSQAGCGYHRARATSHAACGEQGSCLAGGGLQRGTDQPLAQAPPPSPEITLRGPLKPLEKVLCEAPDPPVPQAPRQSKPPDYRFQMAAEAMPTPPATICASPPIIARREALSPWRRFFPKLETSTTTNPQSTTIPHSLAHPHRTPASPPSVFHIPPSIPQTHELPRPCRAVLSEPGD